MSFLKAITPTIRKEISVKTPDGEHQFAVLWKRPNDDQRLELIASINASVEAMNAAKTATEQQEATQSYINESRKRIHLNIAGWELYDENNEPVPFDDRNLIEMLKWTEYRNPLDASLMSVLNLTQEDAKAGNLLSADATSPAPTTVEK